MIRSIVRLSASISVSTYEQPPSNSGDAALRPVRSSSKQARASTWLLTLARGAISPLQVDAQPDPTLHATNSAFSANLVASGSVQLNRRACIHGGQMHSIFAAITHIDNTAQTRTAGCFVCVSYVSAWEMEPPRRQLTIPTTILSNIGTKIDSPCKLSSHSRQVSVWHTSLLQLAARPSTHLLRNVYVFPCL